MLAVAVERVEAEGLLVDYANIGMEDLIRAAGVPRSTVFRIWPDRVAFVADLVRALFEADQGFEAGFDPETLQLLQGALAHGADSVAGREAREVALRHAIRLAVAHNVVAVESSVAYRAYRTMSAALAGSDAVPGGDEIRALLVEIEDRYLQRMAAMYGVLNDALGLRMRSGTDTRDLAVAVMATIDGVSDHRRIDPSKIDAPRAVAMGSDDPEEWHVAALAVYGIYTMFTVAG
jgi:AcrR family transcriptional regulator